MIHPALIRKQRIIMTLLTALILGTIVIGMGIGDAPLAYNKVFPTLFVKGNFTDEFVLFSIRLPRILITL